VVWCGVVWNPSHDWGLFATVTSHLEDFTPENESVSSMHPI
jgi:hypothetical protein